MNLKAIFALILTLTSATVLSAAPIESYFYGVAMASCVPTGQTSAQSVLINSAAEASFRDGSTGEIILTCPIPQTLKKINHMRVRYKDDGVLHAGSQVVAALRQKKYAYNGIIVGPDSVPETIAQLDSNAFVPPVVSPQGYRDLLGDVDQTNGVLILDHFQYLYYIQVNMRLPAGAIGPVTVSYVRLDYHGILD